MWFSGVEGVSGFEKVGLASFNVITGDEEACGGLGEFGVAQILGEN